MTTPAAANPALAARLGGTPLVVLLDVDGTLAPIAPRPEDATVPEPVRRTLTALTRCDGVYVALVSGRAASDAARLVGVSGVWVIGNHGFEVRDPTGQEVGGAAPAAAEIGAQPGDARSAVAAASRELHHLLGAIPGVIIEDKGWTMSVHVRLADRAVVPSVLSTVERTAANFGLRTTAGKEVVEVRPPVDVDKGTATVALASQLGAFADGGDERAAGAEGGTGGSCVFIGDDRTDEDAFVALRARAARVVTVRVTSDATTPTAAEFTLPDPTAVSRFLSWIVALRSGAGEADSTSFSS